MDMRPVHQRRFRLYNRLAEQGRHLDVVARLRDDEIRRANNNQISAQEIAQLADVDLATVHTALAINPPPLAVFGDD